ncbi:MAG TPA: dihydroneopterin triphosphate diphosphatase [Ottowia sp.]|nr:dihydroneopterin triphosphate diphosphatase [Ottowia sp.]
MSPDPSAGRRSFKIPESVLVVVYTPALDVLLIRRADVRQGEFWQSVTGSKAFVDEALAQTAVREVGEETALDAQAPDCLLSDWRIENVYEIYPRWRHRYAPGVTHNREHVFGLRVPEGAAVRLNPREHDAFVWLPWRAAADRCFSPTNAEACLLLPRLAGVVP